MKKRIHIILFSLLLVSILVYPIRFSEAEIADTDTNVTNQTARSSLNQTATNATNMGQQVSAFVHNANALFKQQREETLNAIKGCHEKIQNATSDEKSQIIDECQAAMKSIHKKYQDERKQFQELFRQFRENIIVLRHEAEGMHVSEQEKEMAMRHINEDAAKNGLQGLRTALEHLKGMGENGKRGIERAIANINGTAGSTGSNESSAQSSGGNTSGTTHVPQIHQTPLGQHGPPSTHPGQQVSHGKH